MNRLNEQRNWSGVWISDAAVHANWKTPSRPSPYFRKEFEWNGGKSAKIFISGLGYYLLYLNGVRIGDHVLDPIVTRYDIRTRFLEYDVTTFLTQGRNTIAVILGNGWYNCQTREVWHFDKAPWQDDPKLLFELESDGKTLVKSDSSWKVFRNGAFRFNQLRNGETYDAGLEIPGWKLNGFDDSQWADTVIVPGPGGIITLQDAPPCKVMKITPAQKLHDLSDHEFVYDAGVNMTGWGRLTVKGTRGSSVKLIYSERLDVDGKDIDQSHIAKFVLEGDFQTDKYILSGKNSEIWEPSFTYHGFRYIKAVVAGNVEILSLDACFVRTSFEECAVFECSDPILNKLCELTKRSYESNFTGIPTDCPHREKNGWTGDAFIAAETGLFFYRSASAYASWLQTVQDCQRPNGQLPAIVPSGGWGYNSGSGPAWDGAFVMIPWYIYLYTGDDTQIRDHYHGIKRYLDYLGTLSENHIVKFGLGDWCHYDNNHRVTAALTSTGYYYQFARTVSKYAVLLGKTGDAEHFRNLAEEIALAFHHEFYRGNGIYAKGELTALTCPLYHGLVPDSEKKQVESKLVELVESENCICDFGILGAKYTPRVLCDIGRADLALKMIVHKDYPGWGYWVKQGATTLHESWKSTSSLNHIMFGDIAAWMMQYAAGIRPDEQVPGFSQVTLAPAWQCGLTQVKAEYESASGNIRVSWRKTASNILFEAELPVNGNVILPDGTSRFLQKGKNQMNVKSYVTAESYKKN